MADLKYLINFTDETDVCTNCGTCRTVCPLFLEKGTEISSTRGRINLIDGIIKGELELTTLITKELHSCMNCRKCIQVCPANINYTDLIVAAKADINLNRRPYLRTTFLKYIFNSSALVANISHKLLGFFRKLIYSKNKVSLNIFGKLLFFILKLPSEFIVPYIPAKNFFNMNKRYELKGDQKKRVAFFLGCGGKYYHPDSSDHLVEILRSNGIEVMIPKDQVCCGSVYIDNGNYKYAKMNASVNIKLFNNLQDVDAILVQCSNCSEMLKSTYYKKLKSGNIKIPVIDVIDFLRSENIYLKPRYDSKVSSHILQRYKSSELFTQQLDDFIRSVYNFNYINNINDDRCCGASELYKTANYTVRDIITNKFIQPYIEEGVEYLACSSFACMNKINEKAARSGKSLKAVTLTDLFESYTKDSLQEDQII